MEVSAGGEVNLSPRVIDEPLKKRLRVITGDDVGENRQVFLYVIPITESP